MKDYNQWLTKEEINLLNMANKEGYFETPRRISVDELADKLVMNSTYICDKLNLINKKVLNKFVEQMNTPLRG